MIEIASHQARTRSRQNPLKSTNTIAGGALLATVVGGGLAAAALSWAPAASASCASFFGIGNSANCISTPTTVAIALGPDAQAYALGQLGSAFAVGSGAQAPALGKIGSATAIGVDSYGWTSADSVLGSATALGNGAFAAVYSPSLLGTAFAAGNNAGAIVRDTTFSLAGAFGSNAVGYVGTAGGQAYGNLAIAMGNSRYETEAVAQGVGNIALDVFSRSTAKDVTSYVVASGTRNIAATIFSPDSTVYAGYGGNQLSGSGNTAFSAFGRSNNVQAYGPGAIAGSILQAMKTITKNGHGITINGATQQQPVEQNKASSPGPSSTGRSPAQRNPATSGARAAGHSAKAASLK